MNHRSIVVLLIDQDLQTAGSIEKVLLDTKVQLAKADSLDAAIKRLGQGDVTIILLRLDCPDIDPIEALKAIGDFQQGPGPFWPMSCHRGEKLPRQRNSCVVGQLINRNV